MPEYIARETLEAEIRRQMDECNPMSEGRFYGASFLATVECAAAADVAQVTHGRWILLGKNEHDYETSVEEKCSLCGRYVYRYDTELQDNYCPNCGAKMDKEDET